MRNLECCLFILAVVFISCKKTGNTAPGSPGTGAGSGTGTGTSGLTLTGIANLNPYQGDVVTLTGTGFDPDKTKDTVVLGANDQGVFRSGGNSVFSIVNPKTKIISATATEIKFTTDSSVSLYEGSKDRFALRVTAGTKIFTTTDTLHLKFVPRLLSLLSTDPYTRPCNEYETWAGDSLILFGRGLYGPLTVSIDGKTIDNVRAIDENYWTWDGTSKAMGFINIDFFGGGTPTGNCQTGEQMKSVTVVNGDGRSSTLAAAPFYPGPNTQVTNFTLNASSFQKSKGDQPLLTMSGYAIRNFALFVSGRDNTTLDPFSETLASHGGDLVGTFTTAIDLGALPTPTSSAGADYQLIAKDANGLALGGVLFTLYP